MVPPVRVDWRGASGADAAAVGNDMELFRRFFSETYQTNANVELMVENRNGLVSVRGSDRTDVVVNVVAELYAESGEDADFEVERIRRSMSARAERVEIRTPELARPGFVFFGRGPKVDYDISVPQGARVTIEARNGRIEVRSVQGPVTAAGRNGPITVDDCADAVSVEARNGRVVVSRCGSSVEVKGTNGTMAVEHVRGLVRARTTNGTISIEDAPGGVEASSTNGSLRYAGELRGDFDMQAVNGTIRLTVPADSRFEIDAESRHGSVRSELPVQRSGGGGEGPRPKVKLRTVNGAIRIDELR